MARVKPAETILKHMRAYDTAIDYDIAYCDRHAFHKDNAAHGALWAVLVEVDHAAAMEYKSSADVKERAERIHNWF